MTPIVQVTPVQRRLRGLNLLPAFVWLTAPDLIRSLGCYGLVLQMLSLHLTYPTASGAPGVKLVATRFHLSIPETKHIM